MKQMHPFVISIYENYAAELMDIRIGSWKLLSFCDVMKLSIIHFQVQWLSFWCVNNHNQYCFLLVANTNGEKS